MNISTETGSGLKMRWTEDQKTFLQTLFDWNEPIFHYRMAEIRDFFFLGRPPARLHPLICINPIDSAKDNEPSPDNPLHQANLPRRADCNVLLYRNFMLELDEVNGRILTPQEQIAIIEQKYALPYSTAVWSGGKSVHFIISLTKAISENAWRKIINAFIPSKYDALYYAETNQWVGIWEADSACRNPSRGTRMPDVIRPESGKRQRLLRSYGRVPLEVLLGSPKVKIQEPRPKMPIAKMNDAYIFETYIKMLDALTNAGKGGRHIALRNLVYFAYKEGIPKERLLNDCRGRTSLSDSEVRSCIHATYR